MGGGEFTSSSFFPVTGNRKSCTHISTNSFTDHTWDKFVLYITSCENLFYAQWLEW